MAGGWHTGQRTSQHLLAKHPSGAAANQICRNHWHQLEPETCWHFHMHCKYEPSELFSSTMILCFTQPLRDHPIYPAASALLLSKSTQHRHHGSCSASWHNACAACSTWRAAQRAAPAPVRQQNQGASNACMLTLARMDQVPQPKAAGAQTLAGLLPCAVAGSCCWTTGVQ